MKIQICSDLHLEFSSNRKWLKEHPLQPDGDILLIAGDSYYLNRDYKKLDFIKKAADQFDQVFLIPGNHEYYEGFDVATALHPFEFSIFDNVTILNNQAVEMGGVKFIFSTFWSLIKENIGPIMYGMVDFKRIQYKGEKLGIDHYNSLHQAAFEFVSNEIDDTKSNIVISHHLPSIHCNSEEFLGSPLNEAFCVEKTDFIEANPIDYWIYGHSHRNLPEFSLGGTKMLTNQFGYVAWEEHQFFKYDRVIEVG